MWDEQSQYLSKIVPVPLSIWISVGTNAQIKLMTMYKFGSATFKLFMLATMILSCPAAMAQGDNPKYNKALADSLGGDDYGMKKYILVILKTGPVKPERRETVDSLFKGHMDNINRLAAIGKLVVAGPMKKNDKAYRGIFILNAKDLEEANALLATDPAVKERMLDAELYEWYGSAALPLYLKFHDQVEKKKM
jgi:uncharacterized protein YciI